jgi:hypothetical protein
MEGSEDQGRKGKMRNVWETQSLSLGQSKQKSRKDGAKYGKESH